MTLSWRPQPPKCQNQVSVAAGFWAQFPYTPFSPGGTSCPRRHAPAVEYTTKPWLGSSTFPPKPTDRLP